MIYLRNDREMVLVSCKNWFEVTKFRKNHEGWKIIDNESDFNYFYNELEWPVINEYEYYEK